MWIILLSIIDFNGYLSEVEISKIFYIRLKIEIKFLSTFTILKHFLFSLIEQNLRKEIWDQNFTKFFTPFSEMVATKWKRKLQTITELLT